MHSLCAQLKMFFFSLICTRSSILLFFSHGEKNLQSSKWVNCTSWAVTWDLLSMLMLKKDNPSPWYRLLKSLTFFLMSWNSYRFPNESMHLLQAKNPIQYVTSHYPRQTFIYKKYHFFCNDIRNRINLHYVLCQKINNNFVLIKAQ